MHNKQLAASICQALRMDKYIITSSTEARNTFSLDPLPPHYHCKLTSGFHTGFSYWFCTLYLHFLCHLTLQKVELSVKIMADVVESFLAALTFDQGLDTAEKFLEKYLFPRLKVSQYFLCKPFSYDLNSTFYILQVSLHFSNTL